jgi:hypothetical protein
MAVTAALRFSANTYTYRLLWSEDRQRYLGVCSEFPDLRYEAVSTKAALAGIQQRVATELESLASEKKPVPEPLVVRRFGR